MLYIDQFFCGFSVVAIDGWKCPNSNSECIYKSWIFNCYVIYPRKLSAGTPKLVVCRCFSFSKGVFSGSMLVFGGYRFCIGVFTIFHVIAYWESWQKLEHNSNKSKTRKQKKTKTHTHTHSLDMIPPHPIYQRQMSRFRLGSPFT